MHLPPTMYSTLCHQLRSSLTAVVGVFHVIEARGGRSEADQAVLGVGHRAVDRIRALLDDLETWAYLEGGGAPAPGEAIAPDRLIEEAVAGLRAHASERAVALEVAAGPGPVVADPAHARRAIAHMVARAIAVAPPGTAVSILAAPRDGFMRFEVHDGGTAPPHERCDEAFEPFRTGDQAGMGLALSRAVARAHGGESWIGPGPDGGTVVGLALPLGAPG